MAEFRTIKKHLNAQKVNMGGIILDQAIPLKGVDQIDPFLLIHHWGDTLKGGKDPKKVGVGPHPHRGFTPVTFIFKGGVHHRDSLGENEIVYAGGTQWMDSGNGIVHSERPPKELATEGGEFEIIQFWVNTPKKNKMLPPSYQPLTKENTPWIEEDNVKTGVVAGNYKGKKGPIKTQTDLLLLRIDMKSKGKQEIEIPENYNALIYMLNGKATVNNTTEIGKKDMLWFNNDGKSISITANEDSRLIMLSGAPIGEPVASYGPFVMNTFDEIEVAIDDYNNGKMGQLIEKFD